MAGPRDLFASGPGGTILHSSRDGTWRVETMVPGAVQITGMWSSSVDDIYAAGAPGIIVHAP